jgi:peptidoglycan/xylan/chitin deacetylase (PgdA/CDA1 family)
MAPTLKLASLLYHEVTDDPTQSGFQKPAALPYKHTQHEFARHLEQIATSPVTPELVADVDFAQAGQHLLLTFDDGGKSALHISDELGKRGWRGHFLITTNRIGTRTFLDAHDLRYIRSCGHLIGSHSHTHPNIFKHLSWTEMLEEWRVSCDILAQILGVSCCIASVPGGDSSRTVFRSAYAAGLRYLFTSEPWLTPKQEGACWVLGRVCAKTDTPLHAVRAWAHFQGWSRVLWVRRAKTAAKMVCFPLYRSYVHSRVNE